MTLPVKFLDAAEDEAADAIDWFEQQEVGLGTTFRDFLEAAIIDIQARPSSFPVVHGSRIRKAVVRKFPYSIFFEIQPDRILVYSVFHNSRNPKVWRARID